MISEIMNQLLEHLILLLGTIAAIITAIVSYVRWKSDGDGEESPGRSSGLAQAKSEIREEKALDVAKYCMTAGVDSEKVFKNTYMGRWVRDAGFIGQIADDPVELAEGRLLRIKEFGTDQVVILLGLQDVSELRVGDQLRVKGQLSEFRRNSRQEGDHVDCEIVLRSVCIERL